MKENKVSIEQALEMLHKETNLNYIKMDNRVWNLINLDCVELCEYPESDSVDVVDARDWLLEMGETYMVECDDDAFRFLTDHFDGIILAESSELNCYLLSSAGDENELYTDLNTLRMLGKILNN